MIRKERAEFLDSVLKLFDGKRTIRKKELELKYKGDTYVLYQTEKHLKILEADGLISDNGLDEYHLRPEGLRILNDIESLGYLARHKVAAIEAEKQEEKGHSIFAIIELFLLVLFIFNLDGRGK
jgi:hypothetical protein